MTNPSKARLPQQSANGGRETLLSVLWTQQAPSFPHLPEGAPLSIAKDTIEVKDPERVYRIYRASRRHHFQLLVEAFILQIRYGCCATNDTKMPSSCHCSTPTCFTYRRRVAGSKPIRRFSSNSARQLAVTLASQDNPESALCPHLRSQQERHSHKAPEKQSKEAQNKEAGQKKNLKALNEVLVKSGHELVPPSGSNPRKEKQESSGKDTDLSIESPDNGKSKTDTADFAHPRGTPRRQIDIWAEEQKDVKLDPRSFVQNVFNTDAMRMLEWLTPSSVDGLTSRIKQALTLSAESDRAPEQKSETSIDIEESSTSIQETPKPEQLPLPNPQPEAASEGLTLKTEEIPGKVETLKNAVPVVNKHRRRSDLRATSPPGIKPYNSPVLPDLRRRDSSDLEKTTKLARVNSFSDDNSLQRKRSNEKRTKMSLSPAVKSISSFGHEVVLPTLGEIPVATPKVAIITPVEPVKNIDDASQPKMTLETKRADEQTKACPEVSKPQMVPQSLGVLSEESLEMLCFVLGADAPLDIYAKPPGPILSPDNAQWAHTEADTLFRQRVPRSAPAWKAFAEQSIFFVLSDSRALVSSFTYDAGHLLPNIILQQRFLGLLQVAPDVMLDALWIAAGDLFQMPADLADLQEPKKQGALKPVPPRNPLERRESGQVISILFNALVATLPRPPKVDSIEDTYQERQNGHSYVQGKPSTFALELDDALSNDLALRLARRLFAALSVRDLFLLLSHRNGLGLSFDDGLMALFRTIPGATTSDGTEDGDNVVRASNERMRITGLGLRAWATKIFMEEWNGSPVIVKGCAIGGALSVLSALNAHRDWVLEYSPPDALVMNFVSDRLDASDIPVEWLSWEDKPRQDHLLNYPFLFPKDSLVTYFRAINFSRMSAAYDNAVGIHHRIQALAQPTVLVTGNERMNYLCAKLRVAMSRFMVLNIRRTSPLEDAFDQLWRREERELLRPLKIKLGEDGGELGSDSGGVQAEFFRLAIAEALNPDYGCFTVDDRTKMAWFQPSSPEPIWKFELIGLIVGMAIYNGLTLPITFPRAFYAKLLGEKAESWRDIQDGWPDLASSFQTLLEWDEANGTVEDVFCRTYEFSIEAFGRQVSRNMKPMADRTEVVWPQFRAFPFWDEHVPTQKHSENVPMVTACNRQEFVRDYVAFLTGWSVEKQFQNFMKGFLLVVDPRSLKLFTPEILQEVVEGVQEVSIEELERVVRYEDYTSQSPTIQDFWAVVRQYDQVQRKKLLEFVTASDRVPVGGMAGITFVIQRNGQAEEGVGWGHVEAAPPAPRSRAASHASAGSNTPHIDGPASEISPTEAELRISADSRAERHRAAARAANVAERAREDRGKAARLPTAYTCYGTLLLPEYRDRETLARKLGMALENAKGFGFA